MISNFIKIGFELIEVGQPGAGWAWEYRYDSKYLSNGHHYTLVVFRYNDVNGIQQDFMELSDKTNGCDYRLYVHDNEGKYVSSEFQTSDVNFIKGQFDHLFKLELRDDILEKLLD